MASGSSRLAFSLSVLFVALLAFDLFVFQAKSEHERKATIPRIAIIGSGIGGSSVAHFVRDILGEDAQIQVFERADRIGGRLRTAEIAGKTYEAGGSIIHPENLYMKMFVKELGLIGTKSDSQIFSLYNGDNLVFQTSTWSWLTSVKLLWRYGHSLISMDNLTKDLLKKFSNIYTLQEQGKAYVTVPELLRAMGGVEFYNLTQTTTRRHLQDCGFSELLVDELVTAITRINYGQSTEINAFTGFVSMAGAEQGLWAVEGGNWKVCEGLLEKAKAIVNKNTRIIEIIKKSRPDMSSDQKPLYYLRSDKSLINTPFDVVIVAMPLEIGENFIGCDGCKRWPYQKELGQFQQVIATFQKAKLNKTTFQFGSQSPGVIGTMERPEICFSSIGQQASVLKEDVDDEEGHIWKVFSREPLTKECKEKLFDSESESKEITWLAYPHYTPPEKFLPFILDEGVFYVNAIEWAASAMEMSAVSARNAALWTGRYFKKNTPEASQRKNEHNEL